MTRNRRANQGNGILKLLVSCYSSRKEQKRLALVRMPEIDVMQGDTFEKFMEGLFREKGYEVVRTPPSGDYGADLILQKDGVKTAVECKRSSGKVELSAIQEVVATKSYYSCKKVSVVTNNYSTPQAEQLARRNNVTLLDRNWLTKELLRKSTRNSERQLELPVAKSTLIGIVVV